MISHYYILLFFSKFSDAARSSGRYHLLNPKRTGSNLIVKYNIIGLKLTENTSLLFLNSDSTSEVRGRSFLTLLNLLLQQCGTVNCGFRVTYDHYSDPNLVCSTQYKVESVMK